MTKIPHTYDVQCFHSCADYGAYTHSLPYPTLASAKKALAEIEAYWLKDSPLTFARRDPANNALLICHVTDRNYPADIFEFQIIKI